MGTFPFFHTNILGSVKPPFYLLTTMATDVLEKYDREFNETEIRQHSVTVDVDLNKNVDAKVSNPLAGITYEELMHDVEMFAQEKGLEDKTDLIKRGALVAQDPANFENMTLLEEEEKAALRWESEHKWSHPLALYFTIIVCSIGEAPVGTPNRIRDSWLVGLVNAGPYIGSAFLGCWLSDPCNFYFGRRGTIFISAIFCLLTPIGGAVSQTWEQLFITRLLLGIGMGLKGSSVP